ncbi:hypothetical protein CGC59_01840 [Capnocytophaga sputigena]|uniref:Uncharacterized protein n=1 Tax=Capnocytophaga sputigena TaxID=1019 RepID=A0A250F019_CAPSP|nr:hypothetical protein [Capnocytophaga sputigena]ATA78494.1 hypothetical protein CGC59_01840 [Capnocytophaga sputigena]
MENPAERIEQFLSENPANIITVTQGTARLAKQAAPKYGFSLQDIYTLYGTVSDFLKILPTKGFTTDVKIDLKRLYGSGAKQTSYKIDTLTLNFKKETPMNEVVTTQQPTPNVPTAPAPTVPTAPAPTNMPTAMGYPMGLGYTPVATTDWITSKVVEERYRDLLRDNDTLREDNKDLRSQLRTLNEEKASLRLQLDTADKKHELALKEELLNKKGFWESPAFEKVTETLGAAIPLLAEKMMSAPAQAPVAALAGANLSLAKSEFIKVISNPQISDEIIGELYEFLMQRNNEQTTSP